MRNCTAGGALPMTDLRFYFIWLKNWSSLDDKAVKIVTDFSYGFLYLQYRSMKLSGKSLTSDVRPMNSLLASFLIVDPDFLHSVVGSSNVLPLE